MGAPAVVLEHVVLAYAGDRDHGAADARQHAPEGGGGLIRKGVHGLGGFLRDHERVPGAQRVDVEKREHPLVLVNLVTGNLAADDLAEHRVCHGSLACQVAPGTALSLIAGAS